MGMYDEFLDPSVEIFNDGDNFAIIFVLVYMLVVFAVSALFYVFQSLGYYTTAKRRGIKNPWLAWVPVGITWIMGCVSDQYQYVAKGRVRNKRKAMLILSIITLVAVVAFYIFYFAFLFSMMESEMAVSEDIIGTVLLMLLFALVMAGVSIALTVLQYITLYDLYASSDPKNAVLFIVLSIVVNASMPFLIFACRNKDLGMPPRKAPEEPVYQPIQEPWQNNPEA